MESEAASPNVSLRRSRTFLSPIPVPPPSSLKPRPSSATVIAVLPSDSRARIQILPPPAMGSRPCLIAFSTSVCSIIGGSGARLSASGTWISTASRSPMRMRRISRYAVARSSSAPSVDMASSARGIEVRRYVMRLPSIRSAFGASLRVRSCALASVL